MLVLLTAIGVEMYSGRSTSKNVEANLAKPVYDRSRGQLVDMIEVRDTDPPPSWRKRHEAQIRFLQRKLGKPSHLWAAGGISLSIVAAVAALVLDLPWWAVALSVVLPIIVVSNSIDDLRWRETWRHSLEWNQKQASSKIVEISVESVGYWEFEELEDEGAAFLFRDAGGRWLFLFGQEFYRSERWPCLRFVVRFSPGGGHLETVPSSESVEPERILGGEEKEDLIPRNGSWEVVDSQPGGVLDALRRQAGI